MENVLIPPSYSQAILETERLFIKELSPEIISYLFNNYSNEALEAYLGLTDDELQIDKHKAENGYTTYQSSIKSFLLVVKESGKVIGRCGYHNWYAKHARAEFGYALMHEDDKRKGYMSEAAGVIVKYGFKQMQLNRIEAFIGPANEASQRLIRKLGFIKEGHLREHFIRDGVTEDSICFSQLKREYEVMNKG